MMFCESPTQIKFVNSIILISLSSHWIHLKEEYELILLIISENFLTNQTSLTTISQQRFIV